jgi:hypothetical protein
MQGMANCNEKDIIQNAISSFVGGENEFIFWNFGSRI